MEESFKVKIGQIAVHIKYPDDIVCDKDRALFEGSYRKAGEIVRKKIAETSKISSDKYRTMAISYLGYVRKIQTQNTIQVDDVIPKLKKLDKKLEGTLEKE